MKREGITLSKVFDECFGFSIGDGWLPLVEQLTKDLLVTYPELKVKQVKEKFGALRYYTDSAPPEVSDKINTLINDACNQSAHICELCGQPGKIIYRGGWYRARCKNHEGE